MSLSTRSTLPRAAAICSDEGPANTINGNYVSLVTVGAPAAGQIQVSYAGPRANTQLSTTPATLILSPVTSAGSVDWQCNGGAVPGNAANAKWLPNACR